MIIQEIKGGLGNQMFQFAACRAISSDIGTELFLDLSHYENPKSRSFTLDCFELKYGQASELQTKKLKSNLLSKGLAKIHPEIFLSLRTFYQEKHFHYDENIERIRDNTYLSGYWQSERYFQKHSSAIRDDFTFKPLQNKMVIELLSRIQNTKSVAIHFRRGDFTKQASTHGTCDIKYYQAAIELVRAKIDTPVLYVFSDDIDWVATHFSIDSPVVFCRLPELNDWEEMLLMSNCRHQIIANSSFSWWAAWLNVNLGKIVVAPKKWFTKSNLNTKDLLPDKWIKI